MSEITVEEPTITRFFCHKCNVGFDNFISEYTCPLCSEGFIEEVPEGFEAFYRSFSQSQRSSNMLGEIREIVYLHTFLDGQINASPIRSYSTTSRRNSRRLQRRRRYGSHSPGHRVGRPRITRVTGNTMRPPFERILTNVLYFTGPRRRDRVRSARMGRGIARPSFEDFFNEALTAVSNLNIRGPNRIFISNPIDYFDRWGHNVFDDISMQLLNSFDESPPPLPTNRITELPEIPVTSDQVRSRLKCSVCWEYFEVDEIVRSLPCQHLYHDACIRPWLALHATCPVCRTNVTGETTENDGTSADVLQLQQLEQMEQEHQQITQNLDQLSQIMRHVHQAIQDVYP